MSHVLDPCDFDITTVAVVDEFKMTNDDGSVVATLDERFLEKLTYRMNDRELKTGDLCPIVIGHTTEGLDEIEQPQLVGYARNWSVGPLFNSGRRAAFTEAWIYKTVRLIINGKELVLTSSEIAKRWPRRSAEVWTTRYEVDPISLLGATTPARDLGLMKLSRSESLTYYSPTGEPSVPNPNPMSPAIDQAAAGQSATMETMNNTLQQILAGITKLASALAPAPAAPDAAAAPAAPGAAPDANAQPAAPGDEMSDEELAQLLGAGDQQGAPDEDDESRKGEKPVQNNAMGYPGGANTHVTDPQVKLAREELANVKNELVRMQLQRTLSKIRTDDGIDVDPEDDALISDLAALPADIRNRQIERIKKMSRKAPVKDSYNLESALSKSTDGSVNRIQTPEQQKQVIKLARDKRISFEAACAELNFTI